VTTEKQPTSTGTANTISGGEQRGPVLQAQNIAAVNVLTTVNARATPSAPAQLPPLIADFNGRDEELALMTRLLDPNGAASAVVVSAVAGLAGVGKTSIAVQAGHVANEKGWFSGGILFIDLHGYDPLPMSAAEALDILLRALEVPDEHVPPTIEERAALYRSKVAGIAKPMLVIADNASSEAQVRPLLPGPGPHRVIITSRHTLAGLNARLLDVTVLDKESGKALLNTALTLARPGDNRISGDPTGAARLVGICGGLPLALHIAGAILKSDPKLSADELSDELEESRGVAALRYDDDGQGRNALSVEAAFDLSYARLDETSARLFRLISISPSDDVSTKAASILANMPTGLTRKVLRELAKAHLIEGAVGPGDRWRMHDLVRLYAQRLSEDNAKADGREQAVSRLLKQSGGQLDDTRIRRLTVNLIPRAERALELASERRGDSKTDTINRALQMYAFIEEVTTTGGRIYVRRSGESEFEEMRIV
jgi:hypothetical protein